MHLEVLSQQAKNPLKGAPKLVFVHGICVGAWVWAEHFMPYFAAKGFDVYALSLRGHGASEGKENLQRWTLEDYAADVEQVVSQLDGNVVVIGHSMGGAVVQKWLYSGASRQKAVGGALLASVPPWGLAPAAVYMSIFYPALYGEISAMLFRGVADVDQHIMQRALFSDNVDTDLSDKFMKHVGDESLAASVETQGWVVPMYQGLTTSIPMFVAGAADDKFIPRGEVRQTAFYYRTAPTIVTELAHSVMLDTHWQKMAYELSHWLKGVCA